MTMIESLQKTIEELESDKADLEIMLETVTEHSTELNNEIYEKNQVLERYIKQVELVTKAAAAVEAGTFEIKSLDGVAARDDELGQLARVFQKMTEQVQLRENQLKQQVQELKIQIDKTKKEQQVAEIIETDNFQNLKQKLKRLKAKQKINQ